MSIERALGLFCESNGKVSSIRIWLAVVTLMVLVPWIIMSCHDGKLLSMPIIPGVLPIGIALAKVWQRGKEGLK